MTSDKHAPDSLKYQWRLYGLVSRSEWATGLDKSIAYEIIDNYRKDKGNSRASLTYLENATGADRKGVIASTRRIVERGPFTVARLGEGTRPTEYNLHFDLVAENASSGADTTTSGVSLSSGAQPTTGGGADTTTSDFSSGADTTESVLRNRPKAELQEDGNMNTPAPLADGLAATAGARDPVSAFDKFWQAYPRKYQKPKARGAWDKINPSPELAERIIAAAGEWAAHYAANPVDKKWMPAPANWLAGERYDEDLPSVYADPKEAAIAKKKDRPKKRAADVAEAEPEPFTEIRDVFTITNALLEESSAGSKWLVLDLVSDDDGTAVDMSFCIESENTALQDKDQLRLSRLLDALGIQIEGYDVDPLVGARFIRILPGKFADWEFFPAWVDPKLRCSAPSAPGKPLPRGTFLKIVAATNPLLGTKGWRTTDDSQDDDEDDDLEEAA